MDNCIYLKLETKEGPMRHMKRFYMLAALVVLFGVVFWRMLPTTFFDQNQANAHHNPTTTTPIKHTVFLLMENRTFDHMFGRFPGVNGYTEAHASNPAPDFEHNGPSALAAIDGGRMDEFPQRGYMQYNQNDIPNYWKYAQQFGISDNFFSSIIGDSAPEHVAWVAAQSGGLFDSAAQTGCHSAQNDLIYSRSKGGNN